MTQIVQDDDGKHLVDVTPDQQLRMRTPIVEDPVGNAWAASKLIETIVWSIVVLVFLVVGLIAIHTYLHLF